MESARVIITGTPLGSRFTSADDDVEYLRDPDGVLGDNERFEENGTLPAEAVDTGYRSAAGEALWIIPGDRSSIYVVDGDSVERWPQGTSALCS
jgi:hypothetical protein